MLYLIGLGLNDEEDISIKGLKAIKKCKLVYLESYTSKINTTISKFEKLYRKRIIVADRKLIEESNEIINNSKKYNVALLVVGDPLCATTHINYIIECKRKNIQYKIIHNASIITAIGETGLDLYKFGKTTSIPFSNENIKTPIEVINQNLKNNLHTLVLLDMNAINKRYMNVNEGLNYLLKKGIQENHEVIVCSKLGGNGEIVFSSIKKLMKRKFKFFAQSIIIPSHKLHFIEKEALDLWRI